MNHIALHSVGCLVLLSAVAVATAAPTKTITNLKAAFAGETTAYSKYTKYSKAAKIEGRTYEAALFAAAARAEGYHARNHRRVLTSLGVSVTPSRYDGKVGTTQANLADALRGETYEKTKMYPQFIAEAKSEGANDAVRSFTFALSAEKTHAKLYGRALEGGPSATGTPVVFSVCPTCGETFAGNPPAACPICTTDRSLFVKVK